MKKILFPLFCLLILSFTLTPSLVNAAPTLTISVSTTQSAGRLCAFPVAGTLKLDGIPETNKLVGIQVMSSTNNVLLLRTVNTGSNPQTPLVEIQTVYPSDSEGNPKADFVTGAAGLAYFTITAKNNDLNPHNVMIAINLFDNNNCPIGFAASTSMMPQGQRTATLGVPIPSWAGSGRATVFAGAYSDLPSLNGVPFCSEKSAIFTINGQQGAIPPTTAANGNQGQYSLTFVVPAKEPTSTHTVYVSSSHNGASAFSSTSFTVFQPADFDGNGLIDYRDTGIFVHAYIDYYGGLGVTVVGVDFDGNGLIDYRDTAAFVRYYIGYYS